jgi:hypothetical protein
MSMARQGPSAPIAEAGAKVNSEESLCQASIGGVRFDFIEQ